MIKKRLFPYEFRKKLDGPYCFYCGEIATTDDHFPPLTLCRSGYILPSCRECNSVIGTNWPIYLTGRILYIKQSLKRRYSKLLKTPSWSEEEIEELENNIKYQVREWQKRKEAIQKRIDWDAYAYLSTIDPNNLFMDWLAKSENEILKNLEDDEG